MNSKIINILISLKNASIAKKKVISVVKKKMIIEILTILYEEGIIESFKNDFNIQNNKILIYLKYSPDNKGFLDSLKIISKPSKSVYLNYNSICNFSVKKRLFIISTTLGLKNSFFCKKNKIGGNFFFSC